MHYPSPLVSRWIRFSVNWKRSTEPPPLGVNNTRRDTLEFFPKCFRLSFFGLLDKISIRDTTWTSRDVFTIPWLLIMNRQNKIVVSLCFVCPHETFSPCFVLAKENRTIKESKFLNRGFTDFEFVVRIF